MSGLSDLLAGRPDLCTRLDALIGRSVAGWGCGPSAAAWLASPRLARLVGRLADPEPDRWGRRLAGLAIESPKALRERLPQAILVLEETGGPELDDLQRRGVELIRLPATGQSTFSKQYSASVART